MKIPSGKKDYPKMKKGTWTLIIIAFAALAGGVIYYLRTQKSEIEIQTAKIERGNIQVAVTATGQLNPLINVAVGTQVSGIISKIFVDFNSQVKKGQVIAEIDKTALLTALQDAQANVDKAQFQADQAKRDYDRQKQLYEEKVAALMDYQNAQTNYKAALSTLNSARSQYNRALVNLNYATIIAPIDGIVVSRSVDVGQTVAASFNTPTLFTIANDLTKMQVTASVDEADIGSIKLGQMVEFTVDAYPSETFEGTVKQIRLQPTITQNVVTYSVMIDVSNKDLKLLPGMTANISIIIERHKDVLKIPNTALRFTPDPELMKDFMQHVPDSVKQKIETFKKKNKSGKGGRQGFQRTLEPGSKGKIWIKKGEQVFPVRVEIGLSDGSYTEVKGKLSEDDEVIVNVSKVDKSSASSDQGQNPFAPKFGRGGGRKK